ncbi:MAG: hypothetical protein HY088_01240 [Ignavibacteriales bacterium]|nr:hypothetical protein [Ignavibacteriales bacterium]
MKKLMMFAFLFGLVLTSVSYGANSRKKMGVGVVLGAPTGFSIKYWQNSTIAYQGSIGASFGGGLTVGVDYLGHYDTFHNAELPFYYGAGAYIGDAGLSGRSFARNSFAFGVRGVFGVDYLPREFPFDIAFELGPSLLLTPTVAMGLEIGIALRFYP